MCCGDKYNIVVEDCWCVLCNVCLSYDHPEDGYAELKHAGQKINWFLSIFMCVLCQFLIAGMYVMYAMNDATV